MTLNEFLYANKLSVNNIDSIYHGKDNWCRCGCGGKYFHSNDKGFTRALNVLAKEDRDYHFFSDGYSTWANIPITEMDNKAYTIYFKKGN